MRTAPPTRRTRRLRRIALAWLLVVGATGALAITQAAAAARAHACCPPPAAEAQAPATPCPSLLPLACCDATTLPAAAPEAPEPPQLALALPAAAGSCMRPAAATGRRLDTGPAPPASPLALSVVLRL